MRLFLVAAFSLWSSALVFAGSKPTERPNIVIIMPDDMGWGDVGFHGGSTPTPHLDRLAGESLELERFYTFATCSPTRAAVLSGVFPHRIGIPAPVRLIDPGLPEDIKLLPEILGEAGYRTAMIGKWHLGGEYVPEQRPHQRGFQEFYGSYQTDIDYFNHTNSRGELDWWRNDDVIEEDGYITHLQASEAERLIGDKSTDQPLFLFFAPHAPHTPAQAPAATMARFTNTPGRLGPTYAAMISEFDDAVGRILDSIDASGKRDNTIVIFFSDNGGLRFSNRGNFRGQKNTLYEGGIRSPFLMRWPPKIQPGQRDDFIASVIDLLPTLLDVASITVPSPTKFEGISLGPTLQLGTRLERPPVVIATHEFVAITPRWKLVENGSDHELYDLSSDPSEAHNLVAQEPAIATKLISYLNTFKRPLPRAQIRPAGRQAP